MANSTNGTRTPRLYTLWSEMQELCLNPHHALYFRYGGRGIVLVSDWRTYTTFRQWALATGYRPGAYLLRLDTDGPFASDNCVWTALPDQAEIGRAAPRLLSAFGEERTLEAWSRDTRCGVGVSCLRKRLIAGWTLERAIITPPHPIPLFTAFGEVKSATAWIRDPRAAVSLSTFRGRLAQGWEVERALTTPVTATREAQTPQYDAFGEPHSRSEWLQDPRCQATRPALKRRLSSGWEVERALSVPTGFTRDIHVVTAFNETRPVREWADDSRCRIGARGLLTRLQCGWAPEEAISIPAGEDDQRTLPAFGERHTLAEWLLDPRCQVGVRTVRQRLRQGWEPEQAFTTPGTPIRLSEVTIFGETKSVAGWAADARCKATRIILTQRLRRGWTPEAALTTPLGPSTSRSRLSAFGETKSLADWVRDPRCVVAMTTISERLDRGWELEDALTTPPMPYPHGQELIAFGETHPVSAWLRDPRCLVTRKTLQDRLEDEWTTEEALTTPPGSHRGRRITAFGLTQNMHAWAQDVRCAVSLATLTLRLTAGWLPEDALTTPPFQRLRQLTAFGETHSIAAWVSDPRCEVPRSLLLERLREGWPPERAIATPSRKAIQLPVFDDEEVVAVG